MLPHLPAPAHLVAPLLLVLLSLWFSIRSRTPLHRLPSGTLAWTWSHSSLQFPNDVSQSLAIASLREPVVVKGGPCAQWAAQRWSQDHLISSLPTLVGVRRNRIGKNRFVNENVGSAVAARAAAAGVRVAAQETLHNLSARAFFEEESVPQYFSASILAPEMDALRRDVGSFQAFAVDEGLEDSFLWMTKAGVRAAMHYDTAANFNCQVMGRKRFIVGDPRLWREVHLFPSFHLSARQSQLDLSGESLERVNAALAKEGRFLFREIVLEPGEALFIPAYYFHAVETLGLCVNVNFFSATRLRKVEKQLLSKEYFHPRAFEEIFQENAAVFPHAVKYYIFHLVFQFKSFLQSSCTILTEEEESFDWNDAQILVGDLLESRYSLLFEEMECSEFDPARCPAFAEDILSESQKSALDGAISVAVNLLRTNEDLSCTFLGMVDIFLGDFIEAVLANSLGFQKGCKFWRCISTPKEVKT